jgi:Fe-S oxidoreductase/nickel-dependent lactate racemase
MKLEIPYGADSTVQASIPDDRLEAVVGPADVACGDPGEELARALRHPFGECLGSFLEGGKDVVVIVNDGTRPTPTSAVLDELAEHIDLRRPRYLIATGAHRAPTEEEMRYIFGGHLEAVRDRVHAHDSRKDEFVDLGVSKNGTPMEVNRIAVEADRLIIITSVEPHYFAGYTGGRKSFLPGVASYRTIEANHRLAVSQEARSCRLDGNPVHEDMMDALTCVKGKRIFAVQVVLDRHMGVYRAEAGDLHRSFAAAVRHADEVFSVEIARKADVVVTVAPFPMDIDLYQSQKAIDNAKWAVNDGGTIILVSKCRMGVGDDKFTHLLSFSRDTSEIMEHIRKQYHLGDHKAAKMAEVMNRAEVRAVTSLDGEVLRRIGLRPEPSLQDALDGALLRHPGGKALILLDGSVTVPRPASARMIEAPELEQAGRELMTCTYCGFCKSVCPSFQENTWDPSVARGRMILAYGLMRKEVPADRSVAEYLFKCTTCKDCERRCPSKVQVVDVVERARRDLVAAGVMLPRHRELAESVLRHGNPYGEKLGAKEVLGGGDRKGGVVYFAGCTAAFRNPGLARAAMSIIRKLDGGVRLADERCCGSVLQRIGRPEEDVLRLIEHNVEAICAEGAEQAVFSCAGCYRMFKEEYPRHLKVPFKVRHISEFLAERAPCFAGMKAKVTYHDPCHLGRHAGVYDAPRQVLKAIPGVEFREMPRHRDAAACCGGGGGVRSAFPEDARRIAARRVDEAGFADLLVTSCPFCVSNLRAGAGDKAAKVVDLVELVEPLI